MKMLRVSIEIVVVSLIGSFGSFYVTANDNPYLPGIRSLDAPRLTRDTRNEEPPPCSGVYGPKCDGCQTLLTCADVTINKQSCSSINAALPYCIDNACSAKKPEEGCDLSKNFRCTSAATFPDPDNCEQYYYCLRNNIKFEAVPFDCPPNYVYDSHTGLCKKRATASDCKVVSCANNLNKYQIATFDKSVLVYCADTQEFKETLLFRCMDIANMEWDLNSLTCKFVCKAEGRYADVEDCHKYYDCFRNGTALSYTKKICPNAFKFDGSQKMCTIGFC